MQVSRVEIEVKIQHRRVFIWIITPGYSQARKKCYSLKRVTATHFLSVHNYLATKHPPLYTVSRRNFKLEPALLAYHTLVLLSHFYKVHHYWSVHMTLFLCTNDYTQPILYHFGLGVMEISRAPEVHRKADW